MAEAPRPHANPQPATPNLRERSELRVVLQREAELAPVRLPFRDWPGYAGPIIHVGGPAAPGRVTIEEIGAALAPRYRVLSLELQPAQAPEINAAHVSEFIEQFGFSNAVLMGEGPGAVIAALVAQWCPGHAAGVLHLVDSLSIEDVEAFVAACYPCPPSR